MILDETEAEYGRAEVKYSQAVMNYDRIDEELKNNSGLVTVSGGSSSQKREELLEAVRIPFDKGIIGLRILLVNKEKFKDVKTLQDLKNIPLCFKRDWVDTEIYEANGFKIEFGNDYEGLFKMLQNGRCGWFPRGLNEVFLEYEKRGTNIEHVAIEKNISLYYPLPAYFFVSKANKELATRIEQGFHKIIDNGKFDRFFKAYYQKHIDKAELSSRTIFTIENPILPKLTPLDNKSYWYDLKIH